jgi:hypothetical protein
MALDKDKLKADIQTAFDQAKQQKTADAAASTLVSLLTEAVASYVQSAEVGGITVAIQNNTGTQTAPVKLS